MSNTKNLPATKPLDRLKSIISSDSVKQQFRNAMGKHSDLFVASIIDIVSSDNSLQKCNPSLVISECLKAATLKLPINKSLGFAYIIPYGQKPQFQIGYKGFVQLAMRTGKYKYINADKVYEGELISSDKLTGAIDLSGKKTSDKIVGYFAYIETVNGFKKTIYGSVADVKKHGEKYSPGYSHRKSLWKTDLDSMGIKTMLKMLLGKYGVMSVEMAGTMSRAFEYDNETPEDRLKREIETSDSDIIDLDSDTGEVIDIEEEEESKCQECGNIDGFHAEGCSIAAGPGADGPGGAGGGQASSETFQTGKQTGPADSGGSGGGTVNTSDDQPDTTEDHGQTENPADGMPAKLF